MPVDVYLNGMLLRAPDNYEYSESTESVTFTSPPSPDQIVSVVRTGVLGRLWTTMINSHSMVGLYGSKSSFN